MVEIHEKDDVLRGLTLLGSTSLLCSANPEEGRAETLTNWLRDRLTILRA